jgi:acetyltransferase
VVTTNPNPLTRVYPSQYVSAWTMKDGTQVTIRPIRAEDEPLMVKFHGTLSDRTVYLRYFCSLSLASRTAHERLVRICFSDYDHELVLVAEYRDLQTGERTYWVWAGLISCKRIKKRN